jgi:hypothetical protein
LEIAGPELTAFIFAGERGGQSEEGGDLPLAGLGAWNLNRKLWQELRSLGVNAWMMESPTPLPVPWKSDSGIMKLPASLGIGLPLAEIIPIQLLCVYLNQQAGVIPGTFRHIGKVTTEE